MLLFSIVRRAALWLALSFACLPQAVAQTEPDSALSFEVASLKPVQPTPPYPVVLGATLHGTAKLTNVTLAECLRFAFRITSNDQIAGPDWIKSNEALFEIVGKASAETPPDKLRLMTLNLLTDRFKLALRHEQRELSYWALVVDKKGSKLRETAVGADTSGAELRPGRIILHRASISTLMLALGRLATGRPIVDLTGLKGAYEIKLEWTPLKHTARNPPDAIDPAALLS